MIHKYLKHYYINSCSIPKNIMSNIKISIIFGETDYKKIVDNAINQYKINDFCITQTKLIRQNILNHHDLPDNMMICDMGKVPYFHIQLSDTLLIIVSVGKYINKTISEIKGYDDTSFAIQVTLLKNDEIIEESDELFYTFDYVFNEIIRLNNIGT